MVGLIGFWGHYTLHEIKANALANARFAHWSSHPLANWLHKWGKAWLLMGSTSHYVHTLFLVAWASSPKSTL